MKSTAKTSYAEAELILKERDSAILIEFHYKVSLKPYVSLTAFGHSFVSLMIFEMPPLIMSMYRKILR